MTFDPSAHVHTIKEVDMFRGCLRQGSAKYLHRLDETKSGGQSDGIDMHRILENMLAHGPQANTQPESKVGAWARALYPHAPAGARGELAQQFDLPWGDRASFKLDWTAADFSGFGDWKGCGDVKWALAGPRATPDEQLSALSGDLQANWEAYGFMRVFRRSFVDLKWCYVEKPTCRTWTVAGRLHLQYTENWLRQNVQRHTEMVSLLRRMDPVPPLENIPHEMIACNGGKRQCFALGWCQFKQAPITTERLYELARQPK